MREEDLTIPTLLWLASGSWRRAGPEREATMATITVNVGECLTCKLSDDIRTRGCDPCVALIAISETKKTCAHLSVNAALPQKGALRDKEAGAIAAFQRDSESGKSVLKALDQLLAGHFPLADLTKVGFTWGGNNKQQGAELITDALAKYFSGKEIVESGASCDSLATIGDKIVASKNSDWKFSSKEPTNLLAQLG